MIPVALAVHNIEEAMMFPSFLQHGRGRLREILPSFAADIQPDALRVALLWATLLPLVVLIWATWRPRSVAARWSAIAVQYVVAINVASHLIAAVFVKGYSPGLYSAVLINAPMSVYLLRRATREQWLPPRAWRGLLPVALFLHGPGLLALLFVS